MKKNQKYEEHYNDFWINQKVLEAHNDDYYSRIYEWIKKKITVDDSELKIIDIGGGNGAFMNYLGYKNATILDVSDSGLKLAENNFNYQTIKADTQKRTNVVENSYDVAYCFEVLEHLEFPAKTLSEINNLLKENGTLFLSIPHFKPDGIFHKRKWKQRELEEDLKKTGFEIIWFNNIPRFNMFAKEIKYTNNCSFIKFILLMGNVIFFKKARFFLSKILPNWFTAMQIAKLRKREARC